MRKTFKRFLEEELLVVKELWDNTISLEKHLQEFKVCWIIDGLDEQTNQCVEFLETLVEQFRDKHFFLVTTRPEVDPPSSLPLTKLTIEKFDVEQTQYILSKLIKDEDMKQELISIRYKYLLNVPLNIHLVAELVNNETLDLSQLKDIENTQVFLYDKILKLCLDRCVQRHDKHSKLKLYEEANKWFKTLCKIAAEGIRDECFIISNDQLKFLKKKCGNYLNEIHCLSTFLDFKTFRFKHRSQQEAMAACYLRDLKYEDQIQFFKNDYLDKVFVMTFLSPRDLFDNQQLVTLLRSLYHWWKQFFSSESFSLEDFIDIHVIFSKGMMKELKPYVKRHSVESGEILDLNEQDFESDFELTIRVMEAFKWIEVYDKLTKFKCQLHLEIDCLKVISSIRIEDPSLFSSIKLIDSQFPSIIQEIFPTQSLKHLNHLILWQPRYDPKAVNFEWPKKVTYHLTGKDMDKLKENHN